MTNWCTNLLTVQGESAEVQRFLTAQAGYTAAYDSSLNKVKVPFTFNAQVPVPAEVVQGGYHSGSPEQDREHLLHPDASSGGPISGYVWQVLHWGTARDLNATDLHINFNDNQVHLHFSTVWSPPTTWVGTVAAQWPGLQFDLAYIEPGGGFAGQFTVQGLQIITDDSHDVTRIDLERWGFDPNEDGDLDA